MTGLMDRIRGLASLFWREVAKFGAVGGVAFVIDNGLYWYLIHGPMSGSEVKARFVSAGLATIFAWLANRYWTFRHRRQPNPAREFVMFVLINVIGMGIAAGCVAIAKYGFDVLEPRPLFLVGILGTVLATLVRFVAYRFWVFTAELDAEPGFDHDQELVHPRQQEPVSAAGTAGAGRTAGIAPTAEDGSVTRSTAGR